MAEFTPSDEEARFDANLGAIEDALAQARDELGRLTDAASAADTLADENAEYSLHEVPGIGRYAVVRKTGWRALLKVIHDLSADINFSANNYPGFDAIIGEQFKSPYLLDPLNDNYESYNNLRDNIAAVRNFLMESYYVDTPKGMTPEKAKQAMAEIAKYVGEGLNNNYTFMGIPHHHSGKPFISISEASEPGGLGAQYLYEKILEMHRQSSWMRPFAAVIALFGGHAPPDWMLPPAHQTEFTDMFSRDIAPNGAAVAAPSAALLKHAIGDVDILEAQRAKLIDQHQLSTVAIDLNAMGDQLLYSASNMQNVAHLSEPVRRDAIEIAKDILRKLRAGLGDKDVRNGLNLPPNEDVSALGAIKGVALIYERMLGWAARIDAAILQHPSVMAGTQAIGQLGYLAKREALRMAKVAGNAKLAESIAAELAKVPAAYSNLSDTKFSGLLDKIESGMNVMMNRVQTITGPTAQIGNSAAKEAGSSINQAPTAGLGQQATSTGHANDDAAKRNAQLLAAENAFQQSQATKIQQQNARRPENNPAQQQQRTQQPPQVRTKTTRQTTTTTTTTSTTNPAQQQRTNNPAQQQNMARQAQLQHEQEEHDLQVRRQLEAQRQTQILQQKAAAAKAAAQKIDPNMLKGFQNATNVKGMGPVASVKKPAPPPTPAPQPNPQQKAPGTKLQDTVPGGPVTPNKGGRSF